MTKTDVVIIGSGISALTSAALLSQKGKSVVVLEQAAKPGGYMHSFRRFGELFDTGAHYMGALGPGQPFRVLLEYLNVYDEKQFIEMDPDGFDVFEFPSWKTSMPKGYENVIKELANHFPAEEAAIRSYFDAVRKVIKYFPTYEFSDESMTDIPAEAFETSLAQVVKGLTSNTKLQAALFAYCAIHGVEPQDVAFGFHAMVTDSLIRGAWGLTAGGDALTKSFIDRIQAHGGQVLCKHAVTEIRVKDRTATEVITAGGATFTADWVISSIHPRHTFDLLSDRTGFSPAFQDRVQNIRESLSIFGVYAALKEAPSVNPLKNYFLFKSDAPEEVYKYNPPDEEPSVVFMTCPKKLYPSVGGKYPLCFHAPGPIEWFNDWRDTKLGKRGPGYNEFKQSYTDKIFELTARYHPELAASLKTTAEVASSSPLTNLHFNGSVNGSAYGIYHSIQNTGPRALGPRTKVLNLLLTGQNCLFPGLMGAAVSALRTCGHIVGIKPILSDLKNRPKSVNA